MYHNTFIQYHSHNNFFSDNQMHTHSITSIHQIKNIGIIILCRYDIETNCCGNKRLNKKVNRTSKSRDSIDVIHIHKRAANNFIIDQYKRYYNNTRVTWTSSVFPNVNALILIWLNAQLGRYGTSTSTSSHQMKSKGWRSVRLAFLQYADGWLFGEDQVLVDAMVRLSFWVNDIFHL